MMFHQSSIPSRLLGFALQRTLSPPSLVFTAEVEFNGYIPIHADLCDEEDSIELREAQYEYLRSILLDGKMNHFASLLQLLELSISFEQLSVFIYFQDGAYNVTAPPLSDSDLRKADLIVEYRDSWLLFLSSSNKEIITTLISYLPSGGEVVERQWPFGVW